MATSTQSDAPEPPGAPALSIAEQLKAKHAQAHNPTVESVVDQDDLDHPPPSGLADAAGSDAPLSEKALGKQKVQENQPPAKTKPVLDTQSEESFPALGAGSQPKAAAPKPVMAWGAGKPASLANGGGGGGGLANGKPKNISVPSSAATSRTSTPVSTPLTPTSANAHQRGAGPAVRLPGKSSEKWHMRPATLLPRSQLRKPVPEILRGINNRSRANVTMRQMPDGGIEFEARGPTTEAVQQALRDVSREVGVRQAIPVEIPANARPHIIGKQGATIKDIMTKSGAKLQLPKADEAAAEHGASGGADEGDDDQTVCLTIEGDDIAIAIARREVEEIVSRKAANMSARLRDIPPELYPFLAGPRGTEIEKLCRSRGVNIRIPPYNTWTERPPPAVSSRDDIPAFVGHSDAHIVVTGERQAVKDARAAIERRTNTLRQQIALEPVAISRGQHQFIAGIDGAALHDLLRDTGCAVILPPAAADSEDVIVLGPRDRLDEAVDHVMNLATSMRSQNVDVARAFPNPPMGAPAYTGALARYLRQRRLLEALESRHEAHIVLPPPSADGAQPWEVYSREGKNALKAKTDILALVQAHPPARFRAVDVDPFYHAHLRAAHQPRLRRERGVHMLFPPEPEATSVLLVFEGPDGETVQASAAPPPKPTAADVAGFERALLTAEEEILALFAQQQAIGTRPVPVPSKFREKTGRFVQRDQSELADGHFPVEFLSRPTSRAPAAPGDASDAHPPHDCYLRGPEDRLDALTERLAAFLAAEEADERERGYTISFAFPQRFAHHLIGKGGETINKLRDEFDVEIQVRGGTVEVRGPKTKAHAAQREIEARARRLEDEVAHRLKVEPKLHRDLIGAKGANVNRLQDRHHVRIRFPRAAAATGSGLDDTAATADAADAGSELGTPRHHPPDEILVTGPKKGADAARAELLELVAYLRERGHAATVSVAKPQLPSLIGAQGRNLDAVRQASGAQINVPAATEAADPQGRVELQIKGTEAQVAEARRLLLQSVAAFDDSVTREVVVDRKFHKALIGTGGANIRDMVVQAGGSDDRRALARTVRFPPADASAPDAPIRLEGPSRVVAALAAAIEGFAAQRAAEVTEHVAVPPERHGLLIGPSGATRRGLEAECGVAIDVPKASVQGAAREQIKLVGPPAAVAAAKEKIAALLLSRQGETVSVPRALHHVVAEHGALFRRLRAEHRVAVDHAGQTPPAKPANARNGGAASPAPPGTPTGAPLPLITDEAPALGPGEHRWTVVEHAAAPAAPSADATSPAAEEGTIPWVLRGPSPEAVTAAAEMVRAALARAESRAGPGNAAPSSSDSTEPTATGYLVLADPRLHARVVGPGGAAVNRVRAATGCRVTVPRDRNPGAAVEVVGSRAGVERAKEMILEAVHGGGGNGNGGYGGRGKGRGRGGEGSGEAGADLWG